MPRDILRSSRRLRRRQTFFRMARTVGYITAALVLMGGVLLLPFFRVREISFFGLQHLSREQLGAQVNQALSGKRWLFIPNRNIFILSTTAITDQLYEAFPRISAVTVKKIFPHKITLSITERPKDTIWCAGGQREILPPACFFIDERGTLFQEAPFLRGNMLSRFFDERASTEVSVGMSVLTMEEKNMLDGVRQELSDVLGVEIAYITIKDGPVFSLLTNEGWSALINTRIDIQESVENLRLAFARTLRDKRDALDYIDLRFGDKLYYKYKNAKP